MVMSLSNFFVKKTVQNSCIRWRF